MPPGQSLCRRVGAGASTGVGGSGSAQPGRQAGSPEACNPPGRNCRCRHLHAASPGSAAATALSAGTAGPLAAARRRCPLAARRGNAAALHALAQLHQCMSCISGSMQGLSASKCKERSPLPPTAAPSAPCGRDGQAADCVSSPVGPSTACKPGWGSGGSANKRGHCLASSRAACRQRW